MESNTMTALTKHVHKNKRRKLMSRAISVEFSDVETEKLNVEQDLDDTVNHDVAASMSGDSKYRQNISHDSHSKKMRKSQSSANNEASVSENISDIKDPDSSLNTDAHQCSSRRPTDCETGKKKSKKKVQDIQVHNDDGVVGQEDGFDVNSDVIERPHKKTKRSKNRKAESSYGTNDCGLNGDDKNMSDNVEVKKEKYASSPSKLQSEHKLQVKVEPMFSRFMDTTLNDDERGEELNKMIEKRQEELMAINEDAYVALKRLKIVVPYKEHPSRRYETTLLKPPSQKIQINIASTGLEMKSGKFNLEEDNILRRNWEEFSKEYGVHDPQWFLRFSNNRINSGLRKSERIPFVKYLARDLGNRYLQSVYKRFRKLYIKPEETGKFSDEEDAIIMKYISQHNIKDPHAKIALVLNRSRDAVYRRSRFLRTVNNEESDKQAKPVGIWDMKKKTRLVVCLLKRTNSQRVKQLRGMHIAPEVWAAVAEDIGIRRSVIRHFWEQRMYTQLFAEQPVLVNQICMEVLDKLNTLKITYWQDVKWNEIAEDFPGVSGVFLWVNFKRLVTRKVPREKWEVLRKCVKYLRKHWLPTVGSKPDQPYTKYRFRNGQLVKK